MRKGGQMKTILLCVLIGILTVGCCLGAEQPQWHLWTTTHTVRVLREDPPGQSAQVALQAARGEWRGFQVLMRCAGPIGQVRVELTDLRSADGAVIPSGQAEVYRQHQMEITQPTHRNDQFRPGWYADPLIPARHPITRQPLAGPRFVAMPFDLPAEQTHGFFIDVHVPREAKAGQYRGAVRLTAAERPPVEIPVELTVWDFQLPQVPSLQTAFGSPAQRLRDYYRQRAKDGKENEPADWEEVETQCAALLAQHRFNATFPGSLLPVAQPDGSFRIPPEQIKALQQFVDRYHVNAVPVPHPERVIKDPEANRDRLSAWLRAFDAAAKQLDRPHVLFYVYLKDEPNDAEAYKYVQRWGRAIREAKSAVKVLVVEQPQTQDPAWGDLYGAVDIWCPLFSLFQPEPAAARQALGETIWTYTALCQLKKTPWWHIDYPLLHYRVPTWIAWRYRIRGLLYWGGMMHFRQVEDPWTEANTYRPGPKSVFNGEGTLVYPARPVGYDGIVPSLRLKALRDGIQDYDYLKTLEDLGLAAEAEKIVVPLAGSFFQWEPDPAAYDKARARLAELIISAQTRAAQPARQP